MPLTLQVRERDLRTIFITRSHEILDAPTIEQIYKDLVGVLEKTEQPNVILDFSGREVHVLRGIRAV